MAASKEPQPKAQRLGLRTTEKQRSLLAAASQAEGTTISEFVLRHATIAAEEVLADRRIFPLDPDSWDEFVQVLDRPVQQKPRLTSLLTTPTVFDS